MIEIKAGAAAFAPDVPGPKAPIGSGRKGIVLSPDAGAAQTAALRQVRGAKRSYVTRRIDISVFHDLISEDRAPRAGDIVLAVVMEIGQHRHLELVTGRRSRLFPGDAVLVAYGERYAADQFHARLPGDLSDCSLAASGGIAGKVVARHARVKRATQIKPIGLLADAKGEVLNLSSGAIRPAAAARPKGRAIVIAVIGSSMNAGKTTTAANVIRCLTRSNLKVAACKLTGTGSGADCWLFKDAGADPVLDFTDAGFASTYNLPIEEIEQAGRLVVAELAAADPDFIVMEIADGLLQQETSALIRSPFLKEITDSVVFAAADPVSAAAGVHMLASQGFLTAAISGVIAASPLAADEAARTTGIRVLTQAAFESPETAAAAFLQPALRRRGRP